jgi:hypothetical protein
VDDDDRGMIMGADEVGKLRQLAVTADEPSGSGLAELLRHRACHG